MEAQEVTNPSEATETADYHRFTRELVDILEGDARVVGMVALGSTAERDYAPDRWSDHDVFVITRPDAADAMRAHVGWLPRADHIAIAIRETEHGWAVLYDDGHLVELAVFAPAELSAARA